MDLLSKYDLLTGLRCHKALWWSVHDPSAPELKPSSVLLDRFDQGRQTGELARKYVPGGAVIGTHFLSLQERLDRTAEAIANGASVLYEAAFAAHGTFVRRHLAAAR